MPISAPAPGRRPRVGSVLGRVLAGGALVGRALSGRALVGRALSGRALLGALLLLAHPLAVLPGDARPAAASAQESPCAGEAHDDFDFWVGTWEVHRPDGAQVGTNTIRKVMGGCVLHESYDGRGGYHGESFNVYDRSRGVWHQTWVDRGGHLLVIEGGLRDGAMVLEGETQGEEGPVVNRITWMPLPPEDDGRDRVRQHWEVTRDGGGSWETVFDGLYLRVEP